MEQIATMDGQDRNEPSWRDRMGFTVIGLSMVATVFWCGLIAAAMGGLVINLAS